LHGALTVGVEQVDEVALGVPVAVDDLIEDGDGDALDVVSQVRDAGQERGSVDPLPVRSLAKVGTEVQVCRLIEREVTVVEQILEGVFERGHHVVLGRVGRAVSVGRWVPILLIGL
jgi:hypothetical protein